MDDESLRARIEELEAENARLRGVVGGPAKGVSGGRIVFVFFATLAVAFAVALSLWFSAKRASKARIDAANASPPSTSRVDAAGRAMVHAIAECVGTREGPLEIAVRVKLSPEGTLAILDATVDPNAEELVQCVRRAPALVHVIQGDTQAADVVITYGVRKEPDGTRLTRTKWDVRPVGER